MEKDDAALSDERVAQAKERVMATVCEYVTNGFRQRYIEEDLDKLIALLRADAEQEIAQLRAQVAELEGYCDRNGL